MRSLGFCRILFRMKWPQFTGLNISQMVNHLRKIVPRANTFIAEMINTRYDAFMNGQTPPVFDPAYCGGALMDLNIYNIYFVVGIFGDPKAVHYYPNRHANGIDTSGILILEYPNFVCQCTAAKDSSAHNSAQIIGTEGSILIEPGSNNCQKLVVTRKGKEPYISEISDTPWWFEVLGISNFLIVPQDAVKERRIRAMRSAVAVLEAARKNAHLDF